MRNFIAPLLLLILAGCSATSQQNFKNAIDNFNTDVTLVDGAIKNLSGTLYANCNGIAATAQALVSLSSSSSKVGQGLVAANAAIGSYCQAAQVTDIPTAVQASAAALVAAKTALAAAKAGG